MPSVKRIRAWRSLAFANVPKLRLRAICSAAFAIGYTSLPERRSPPKIGGEVWFVKGR